MMLSKIKDMVIAKNIEIVYVNIPGGLSSVYVERDGLEFIMIHNNIKDTRVEVEELALSLGYIKAMKELGLKHLNTFDTHNINTIQANDLAKIYQKEVLEMVISKGLSDERNI